MAAATVIATAVIAVATAAVLLVRTYAGTSVAIPGGSPTSPIARSPIARLRDRLARADRRKAAVAGALVAWAAALIAAGWMSGLVVGLLTERGSVGAVDWFAARRAPWLNEVVQVVTWLGDSTVVVPVAVTVGLAWRWRRGDWWAMTLLAVAYVGSGVIFNSVKFAVARSRPALDVAIGTASGASYPSGHTANATVLYVGLLVVALATGWGRRRDARLAALAGGIVAAVGVSRIYLGLHWLTDVIGGVLLAGLWMGGVVTVLGARPHTGVGGPPTHRPSRGRAGG